jgi:hypothetical protein
MKNLYESILDIEDTMTNMEDEALEAAFLEWLKKHTGDKEWDQYKYAISVQTNRGEIVLDRCYTLSRQCYRKYSTLTVTEKDKTLPEHLLPVDYIDSVRINGFKGEEFPKNLLPYDFRSLITRDCPNLKTLPPMPHSVEIFSVMDCPKLKDPNIFPDEVRGTFKWVNNGFEIKKNKINKYFKSAPLKIIL